MKQALLNRINLILCFAGLFITGMLSLEHLIKIKLPCGVSSGCEQVAQLPISQVGPIPIALLGVGLYLVLGAMAFLRGRQPEQAAASLKIGYALSALATLMSIGLQIYTASVHLFCPWCFAHAVTITVIFLLYGVQWQQWSNAARKGARAPEADSEPVAAAAPRSKTDVVVVGALGIALVGALWFSASNLGKGDTVVIEPSKLGEDPVKFLVPEYAHISGPKEAPITLIEFGDLCCDMCQEMYPVIEQFIEKHKPNIRYVFRHFPLHERHPYAATAAILAEFAGKNNKFWQYIDQVYSVAPKEVKSIDFYLNVLKNLGLDTDDAMLDVKNQESEPWNRMYKDLKAANQMGLTVTPSFIVMMEGQPPAVLTGQDLFTKLEAEPYGRVLKGNGAK
ncbi:MAG: thioredoxin domain-containing protein [Armatimonadetes bacterium]|nr:thioredoxin domain-containing protein [Armatimonadota bacterium]